jgi:GAF domain-containing protein
MDAQIESEWLDSPPEIILLADVLRLMQADLLHVNPTSSGLDRPVADVVMFDPLDSWAPTANRIILAAGVEAGTPQFDDLLSRAEDGDATAVIVKLHDSPIQETRSIAARHALPVLIADDRTDWTRLVAVARAAVLGGAADSVSGVRLGDLYAFANAVASLTNGATSIVDPVGRILGYSTLPGQTIDELRRTTTLALQESTPPALDADFKSLYASTSPILVRYQGGDLNRLATAVRAGGELLGSIWIIDPGEDRHTSTLAMLEKIAPLAGLHMLHARSASDFGQRRNGDLLRTIMQDPEHASFAAAQLGIEPDEELAVAAFALARPDPGSLSAVRELQRLLHLVTTMCNIQFTVGHTALLDSVVYALLPSGGADPRKTHRRTIEEIRSHSHAISPNAVIATVGGISRHVGDLSRSKSEALDSLMLLRDRQPAATPDAPTIGLFEDFRVQLAINKVGAFIAQSHLDDDDDIARIRAYDEKNHTDYLATLRAYLDANASFSIAATRLQVHNNTVRYRITRLIDDFGIDLTDPRVRLWYWIRVQSSA